MQLTPCMDSHPVFVAVPDLGSDVQNSFAGSGVYMV